MVLDLSDAVVTPVRAEDVVVGWSWTGPATLTWTFDDEALAWGAAHRLHEAGLDLDEARQVGHLGRVVVPLTRGVVVGLPQPAVTSATHPSTVEPPDEFVLRLVMPRAPSGVEHGFAAVEAVDASGTVWSVRDDPNGVVTWPVRTLTRAGSLLDEAVADGLPAVIADRADVVTDLVPSPAGVTLRSRGDLSLRVVRGPVPVVGLRFPPGSSAVTVDAETVSDARTVWVRLPEPAATGATISVHVAWSLDVDAQHVADGVQVLDWLPSPRPLAGRRWYTGQVEVRRPASWPVEVSVAGVTETVADADSTVVRLVSQLDVPQAPVLSLGDWDVHATSDAPAVRAYAPPERAEGLWAFRAITEDRAASFTRWGDRWPCGEVDFVPQDRGQLDVWYTAGCVVTTRPHTLDAVSLERLNMIYQGDVILWMLTHELAHLLWGVTVASPLRADRWWPEALAEYVACQDSAARDGDTTCASALRFSRLRVADLLRDDDVTPWPWSDDRDTQTYAAGLLFAEHLRLRLGTEVLDAGLRRFLAAHHGGVATAADLRQALEAESGVALAGAFGALAMAGRLPRATVAWDRAAARCVVTVTPGIGPLDVPVRVRGARVWVSTMDGHGEAPCPSRGTLDRVPGAFAR